MLEEYRRLNNSLEYQTAYTRELEQLQASQEQRLAQLRQQIDGARITQQRIVALMRSTVRIETLWVLLHQEMTEAGKIASFVTAVVSPQGLSSEQQVVRAGTLSAYNDAGFLRFIPETAELLALSCQPSGAAESTIKNFIAASTVPTTTMIDPTRSNLLGMMGYTPSLRERIDQGGLIGKIIMALGAIGLLITCWRSLSLAMVYLRIRHQLRNMSALATGNPLGRVMLAVQQVPGSVRGASCS